VVAVLGAVAWNCWAWHAELTGVPYLDDSSVHEQMVRMASSRISAGHLPLTSWFPYLGLGSPQFLHYQGLPSMLTGTLGLAIGADNAFRWTLYLLLALWPIPVFVSARLLGLSRAGAAVAAALSPFLSSALGVGYEPKAYIWIGYGVWAQLWASWTLPLAWGLSWRAMTSRRAVFPAVVFVSLTMALHFETGYLAAIALVIMPFLCFDDLRQRMTRALMVAGGSVLASAWVLVPLWSNASWAAINEPLAHTPLVNGYGFKQVMAWVIGGRFYDTGRFPVLTILVGLGIVGCVARWRHAPHVRVVGALWVMSLVLSFGRTTFGSLTVLLPGSTDIFMRRFMMGAQLAGLYLAGIGALAVARVVASAVTGWNPRLISWSATPRGGAAICGLAVAIGVAVLTPVWWQMSAYANDNTRAIDAQHAADAIRGPQIGRLLAYVRSHGGGRVYAGLPTNWGANFTVGYVPVFKYLEDHDIDEVGYTLRTASLMTDPEYFFDEDVPGDYALFGIHYLLLPAGRQPPLVARLVAGAGPYRLWTIPGDGYLDVVDTVGVLSANRSNVGIMAIPYLRSPLPGRGQYLAVAYNGGAPAPLTVPSDGTTIVGPAGTVRTEDAHLADGTVSATVVAHRRAVVALSASFDPGWTVRVDGRAASTEMLAPAIVGVSISPGAHTVVFRYVGYRYYPELLVVLVVTVVVLAWVCLVGRPSQRRARW
jgi:hypothetical protein